MQIKLFEAFLFADISRRKTPASLWASWHAGKSVVGNCQLDHSEELNLWHNRNALRVSATLKEYLQAVKAFRFQNDSRNSHISSKVIWRD